MGGLGLDHERRGFVAVQLAVTVLVADREQQLDVALHVQVARAEVCELHGALRPARLHRAEREAGPDDEVLHVGGVNVFADLEEAALPRLALPAVARVGVDREARVVVADVHQHQEVIGAHGGGAGMDLMA